MLIKGSKALLQQGFGATTTSNDLEEAGTHMLQLEEQARMNYYALSALGGCPRNAKVYTFWGTKIPTRSPIVDPGAF